MRKGNLDIPKLAYKVNVSITNTPFCPFPWTLLFSTHVLVWLPGVDLWPHSHLTDCFRVCSGSPKRSISAYYLALSEISVNFLWWRTFSRILYIYWLFLLISSSFGIWENLVRIFHVFGKFKHCYSISLIQFIFPVILDTSVIEMVWYLYY